MRRIAAGLAVALVLGAVPAAAQVTQDDLERARQRIREVSSSLDEFAARYEAATQQEIDLRDELDRLVIALAIRERELAEARATAREIVLEMYMNGTTDLGFASVFDASSFSELPARARYLESLAAADQSVINHLSAVRSAFLEDQERMSAALVAQGELSDELAGFSAMMDKELAEADAEYRALRAEWQRQEEERIRREEEERQRRAAEAAAAARAAAEAAAAAVAATSTTTTTTATSTSGGATTTTVASGGDDTTTTAPPTTTTTSPPPPPSSGGRHCPIDGANAFSDTWGAGRSGGRTHQGVDMFASRGTPLVAVETGTITRMNNGTLSGYSIWLRGEGGDEFFYAHLDGYASGLSVGKHVHGGSLVGYVGNTGNARYTSPHLHFEYHPGGGSAINPTPLATSLCR